MSEGLQKQKAATNFKVCATKLTRPEDTMGSNGSVRDQTTGIERRYPGGIRAAGGTLKRLVLVAGAVIIALSPVCAHAGNHGTIRPGMETGRAFTQEAHLTYYYTGNKNSPRAIIGIDSRNTFSDETLKINRNTLN
ncbi:hypothetical protein ES708_19729 [subsurface metagenome]